MMPAAEKLTPPLLRHLTTTNMNQYKVLTRLCAIACISKEEADNFLPICSACSNKIEARLKNGANPSDDRLVYAAAALAYYHLSLIRSAERSGPPDSVTVGDVSRSWSKTSSCVNAKALCDEALSLASDLLVSDMSFFFRGV